MSLQSLLIPLLLVLFVVPLFLGTRKQKRAMQQQQDLQKSLHPGDRVMTTSGLFATVASTHDESNIDLEIAPGVVTTWLRAAVREKVAETDGLPDYEDDTDEVDDMVEEDDAAVDETESGAELAPSLEESSKKSR